MTLALVAILLLSMTFGGLGGLYQFDVVHEHLEKSNNPEILGLRALRAGGRILHQTTTCNFVGELVYDAEG